MRLEELARRLEANLEGDGDVEIHGLAPIDEAGPGELTFVANPKYRRLLASTRASAVIVGLDENAHGRTVVRAANPYLTFVRAMAMFDARPIPEVGVHPTAVVSPSAHLGANAYVGPYVVIGDEVVIGADARIHPHVTIYPQARIGDRFLAHAGSVVREGVIMGDDVTLQPGVVVGGDGFGFIPTGGPVSIPIPQIGTVRIGDSVDIGANTTVDRAAVGETRLATGVKLDNLVMVAHGCKVGEGSMLAAQVGVAGSTTLGRNVMLGGQVGVTGHVSLGDGVQALGATKVLGDVAAGQTVAGQPQVEANVWRRYAVLLRRLPELFRRVRQLESAGTEPADGDE